MMNDTMLSNFIDIKDLQLLQDAFVDVADVTAVIVDAHGRALTRASNVSPYCRLMLKNPVTRARCACSTRFIGDQAFATRKPVRGVCRNLGIVNASAPIIREGTHVANWMINQGVRVYHPESQVQAFARRFVLPADEVLEAYINLPLIREVEFNNTLKLLTFFIGQISQVSYKNTQLTQANTMTMQAVSVLGTVMSNLEAMIYVCDPCTYELIYINDTLRGFLGLGDRSISGTQCYGAIMGYSGPCPSCPCPKLFTADGAPHFDPYHWEYHSPRTGRDRYVVDRLITWHDGRLMHMHMSTDITDRNAVAMSEASNMVKREFMARMSHELRTPMNGVLGMTQLALQADPAKNPREYLHKIQLSATHLLGIIGNILDYSGIESGAFSCESTVFNLPEAIGMTQDMLAHEAGKKNLTLEVRIAPDVPLYVEGDRTRLTQIVLNLLSNAVKFTERGGVTLNLSARAQNPEAIMLECTVEDTGIGMSPEQVEELFAPFEQADSSTTRRVEGAGLGLALCRALVRIMQGDISIRSEPGVGSVVSFYVLVKGAQAPHAAQNGEDLTHRYVGRHILVVEDNEINQEIAVALLEDLGASVDVAENGEQAVDAFLREEYDLILMDLRMPGMDGYEATRRIRASSKEDAPLVPIVAMTANTAKEDKDACFAAGMNGHLAKPIDFDGLRRTLARWLDGKQASDNAAKMHPFKLLSPSSGGVVDVFSWENTR